MPKLYSRKYMRQKRKAIRIEVYNQDIKRFSELLELAVKSRKTTASKLCFAILNKSPEIMAARRFLARARNIKGV